MRCGSGASERKRSGAFNIAELTRRPGRLGHPGRHPPTPAGEKKIHASPSKINCVIASASSASPSRIWSGTSETSIRASFSNHGGLPK